MPLAPRGLSLREVLYLLRCPRTLTTGFGKMLHHMKEKRDEFLAKRAAGERPILEKLYATELGGNMLNMHEQLVKHNGLPGLLKQAYLSPDQRLSDHEFDKFCREFQATWEAVPVDVLHSLTQAVRTPTGDPAECLVFLHALGAASEQGASDFGPKGFLRLLSTLYSLEGADIDTLAGFPPSKHGHVHNPAAYQIMNVAARLVAGEQRRNNDWPEDAVTAQEPFRVWVKALAYLTASSRDMRQWRGQVDAATPELAEHFIASLVARGAQPERIREGFQCMMHGLAGCPQLAGLSDMPSPGPAPCLFCGLSLGWDKERHTWNMWKDMKAGENMYFCGLRSMTPCVSVALGFLDPATHQNVLICLEGAERALPLWFVSAYPDEMEALVPCLTKCELVCDPVDALKACFGVFAKFARFGFILVRMRYTGLGMDDSFQRRVLAEGPPADELLAHITELSTHHR